MSSSVLSETRIEPSTAVKAPIKTAVFITSWSRLINCDRKSRKTKESWRIGVTTISGATASEAYTKAWEMATSTAEERNHGRFSRFMDVMSAHEPGLSRISKKNSVAAV